MTEDKNLAAETKSSKLREIVKDGSGLGLLKVTGTALTAVSMAIISAKITGFVNSLMLVAILSIGTAVVNEFYRIILSFTSLGAKKIVLPVIKTVEDKQTGEIIIIDEETPIVAVDVVDIENNIQTEQLPFLPRVKEKIVKYFKNNKIMRFVFLFAIVSMITIGVSYIVAPEKESTVYTYTTNHTTEQQIIESPANEPIVEEKTVIVKEEAESQDTSEENKEPEIKETSEVAPSVSNNSEEIEELRIRIGTLEEENTELKTEIENLQQTNNNTDKDTNTNETVSPEELNEQIQELQRQIDELRNSSTNTPTSQENLNNNEESPSTN